MADKPKSAGKPDDILAEAMDAFKLVEEQEAENRREAQDDIRFARLGEQWPDKVRKDRELEGRPCLTINRLPAFIRQVVNDARQNKPAIVCHPVDSQADPETAEIFNGLIRNIEQSSDAEVAYDTALDFAVTGGFGYFRINTRYTHDDAFDQDLVIERVANPFSVYGDPNSTAADSADWNTAFVVDTMPKEQFQARWKGAEAVDWSTSDYAGLKAPWFEGDRVMVAEYWKREEIKRQIVALSDGQVMDLKAYEGQKALFDSLGVTIIGRPRDVAAHKVVQRIMTGAEVLETVEWAGKYIPIVPVYGEELHIDGRRVLRSLVRDAKDPQRMFNYWRPLALDTPLPTPSGWTTMGAVEIGDQLFDETGQPCNVIGKSPVHINRRCFRVEFDDGSHIIADAEHPWRVEERAGRTAAGFTWQTRDVTTEELVAAKHFIPVARPVECVEADLPVDPYVLGLWLGDGHTMSGRITPGDEDLEEIVANVEAAGYRIGTMNRSGDRHITFTPLGLQTDLKAAGVLGFKHIPAEYLRASEAQRWALLQGLMDSDGSIATATKACDFTTTSPALSDAFGELLRTLGIKAKVVVRQGRASKLVGGGNQLLQVRQFYFSAYADEPVFKLRRKAALLGGRVEHRRRTKRHGIAKVSRVSSVPVQCVAIDAPSHLFLAGAGMVPTHNTTSTELVALAPKAPFIGQVGQFETDGAKWATANTQTHAFIEYDAKGGAPAPQRQPFAGVPAGALQEALNASDDMKSIMGMYDASLGARSNETSGRAIMARQREGDVSTFHYVDNLSRAIRHAGRILIDLIPKTYAAPRVLRILGPDGKPDMKQVNQEHTVKERGKDGQVREITKIYDLTTGKYDLVVKAGPSFTSRREEAANQMIELIRAHPAMAPMIGDILAENLDWPGADQIAKRLKAMLPPNLQAEDDEEAPNPQVEQAKQVIQQLGAALKQAKEEAEAAQNDNDTAAKKLALDATKEQVAAALNARKLNLEERRVEIDGFNAETNRIKALNTKDNPLDAEATAQLVAKMVLETLLSPDILEGKGGADFDADSDGWQNGSSVRFTRGQPEIIAEAPYASGGGFDEPPEPPPALFDEPEPEPEF
ncbi:portal protein [Phenylobacterium sp.]|uniref:portal protein n=1 Tax=Phenylobacterium sp. TaxID=1871053 RepID=UPI002FCB7F06